MVSKVNIFSLILPFEKFIYGEISYEEYSQLGVMKILPPEIPRKLINKAGIAIKRHKKQDFRLITEEEELGMQV